MLYRQSKGEDREKKKIREISAPLYNFKTLSLIFSENSDPFILLMNSHKKQQCENVIILSFNYMYFVFQHFQSKFPLSSSTVCWGTAWTSMWFHILYVSWSHNKIGKLDVIYIIIHFSVCWIKYFFIQYICFVITAFSHLITQYKPVTLYHFNGYISCRWFTVKLFTLRGKISRFTALTLVTDLQNTCDSPWHSHNKVKLPACSRVKCPLDTYIFFINDFGKCSGVRTSQGQSASLAVWALGRSWCEGSVQCLMSILGRALSAWHGHWASPGPSSFSSSSLDCSVTVAVNPTTDKNETSAVNSKYFFLN